MCIMQGRTGERERRRGKDFICQIQFFQKNLTSNKIWMVEAMQNVNREIISESESLTTIA